MNYREITQAGTRRALIAAGLRYDGLTFKEIGERMGGITVETARQAVLKGQRIMGRHYAALNECAEMITRYRPLQRTGAEP